MKTKNPHRPRIRTAVLASIGVAGGALAFAAPAQSQTAACAGTAVTMTNQTFGWSPDILTSFADAGHGWVTSRTFAASIPAGTYDLNARSYDGYEGRSASPAQPGERWRVEFLGADGTVLATSEATPDLADGVEEASWSGPIGRVTLPAPAVQVRAVHAAQGPGPNPNSVRPVCVGAVVVPPPTTTTTVAPPPPTVAEVPPTTVETEVLPEVATPTAPTPVTRVSAPARPQTAQPRLTG